MILLENVDTSVDMSEPLVDVSYIIMDVDHYVRMTVSMDHAMVKSSVAKDYSKLIRRM